MDDQCGLTNPFTTRNCPYGLMCAVCGEDEDREGCGEGGEQ